MTTRFTPVHVEHRGKPVLRLDYKRLSPRELVAAFDLAGRVIRAAPPASLRVLTVLDAHFDERTSVAFREYALENRPHVLASAALGTAFWRVLVMGLQLHGREDVVLFDDEPAALDWLASR
jgi:hypothetical protein